ncbi:MAG: hypothetical protein A6D91_04960 [Bacillaceae bacterium G1]|nr:serine protease [Bacillota bacterium]OJF16882.1 MAG: hypothetical protein A6D91_04960 [Bacillaceae bacterium G1]
MSGWIEWFNPDFWAYLCLTVVLIAWRNGRLAREERRMFHVRLHGPVVLTVRQLLEGVAAGLILSGLLLGLGVVLTPDAFALLWGFSLLLFLFQRRWQPLSYTIGLLWLLGLVLSGPFWQGADLWWRDALAGIHWPAWLALLGLLQWGEAWLLRRFRRRQAYPLVLAGRRGLPVGGYRLEGWWPLPLLVWSPGGEFAGWGPEVPWWPLLADGSTGWTMVPLPLYAGFSCVSRTVLPDEQAAWWETRRWLGGLLALALAALGQWWPPLAVVSVGLFLLWEWGVQAAWFWREQNGERRFLPDKRGLTVLAVIPGSPAAAMGIEPGEVVVKVNGQPVSSERELYHAVQKNPAFCKLEVLDHRGEVRFVQRAVYEGEHHQLGIIAVPTKAIEEEQAYRVSTGLEKEG